MAHDYQKKQIDFKKRGFASILEGVMALDRSKIENVLLPLNNLNLTELIALKFRWYITISTIQVEFENRNYASTLAGLMAHDKLEKIASFRFLLNHLNLNELIFWLT